MTRPLRGLATRPLSGLGATSALHRGSRSVPPAPFHRHVRLSRTQQLVAASACKRHAAAYSVMPFARSGGGGGSPPPAPFAASLPLGLRPPPGLRPSASLRARPPVRPRTAIHGGRGVAGRRSASLASLSPLRPPCGRHPWRPPAVRVQRSRVRPGRAARPRSPRSPAYTAFGRGPSARPACGRVRPAAACGLRPRTHPPAPVNGLLAKIGVPIFVLRTVDRNGRPCSLSHRTTGHGPAEAGRPSFIISEVTPCDIGPVSKNAARSTSYQKPSGRLRKP